MLVLANLLFEAMWVGLLYGIFYYGIHTFMEKYARTIKVFFQVDIKYFNYNNEFGNDSQHSLLHLLSSTTTYILLSINPIVHTAIFMWFSFIDVTQVNRLVLNMCILRFIKNFNVLTLRWNGRVDPFVAFQLVYTSLNFWNRSILAPSLFFLVDESIGVVTVAKQLKEAHDKLVGFDDRCSMWCLNVITWCESNAQKLQWGRIFVLVALLMVSLFLTNLTLWSEVVFYYWGAFRIASIYNSKIY